MLFSGSTVNDLTIYGNLTGTFIGILCITFRITSHICQGCKNLKSVILHDSIKVIGDYAFMDCHKLEKINLPVGLERLGRSAFFNCYNLGEEITIWHKTKLIGLYAFGNCYKLKVVRCNGTAYIPFCEKFAFGDIRPINMTLIVPPNTKNGYIRIQEWQDFTNIIEE